MTIVQRRELPSPNHERLVAERVASVGMVPCARYATTNRDNARVGAGKGDDGSRRRIDHRVETPQGGLRTDPESSRRLAAALGGSLHCVIRLDSSVKAPQAGGGRAGMHSLLGQRRELGAFTVPPDGSGNTSSDRRWTSAWSRSSRPHALECVRLLSCNARRVSGVLDPSITTTTAGDLGAHEVSRTGPDRTARCAPDVFSRVAVVMVGSIAAA